MKKVSQLILIGVFALIVSTAFAQDIAKYSVHIFSVGYMGLGSCTGTVIDNSDNSSTVLTCKHCVEVDRETWVDGQKVTKILTSSGEDLALLITEGKIEKKEVAKLATDKGKPGDRVYMYGQPGFTVIHERDGKILAFSNDWGFAALDVIPGCSGSGLFNENNEVIGVVWGAYTEQERKSKKLFKLDMFEEHSIGIFTPLDKVNYFLDKLTK